jgi:hypothetical protein
MIQLNMSSPPSVSKNMPSKKQVRNQATSRALGLLFDPEDESDMFVRNFR